MQRWGRTKGLWATVGVVAMMALVLPVVASAAPVAPLAPAGSASFADSANGSASQQWAYGGSRWANVSLQVGNASYTSHAFFGWQVILTATNTSASTVELEAQRTMAASLFANYCTPNCTHPSTSGNVSIQGSESAVGFVNLSENATVYENGNATPAVGLSNAASRQNANLNESFLLDLGGHTTSGSLMASGASHAQVTFSPALGLIPWNLTPRATWNSSANFTGSGAWSYAYNYSASSFLGGSASGSGNPSGSVNGSGTVELQGEDFGTIKLANNQTVPEIGIAIGGPFDDEDGIILVPHDFAMFGGGGHEYDSHAFGLESVATSRLDLSVDSLHHRLQIVAAASSYSGTDSSLSSDMAVPAAAPGGPAGPSTELVQAQPESIAQAQHASSCLRGDCSAAASHGAPGALLALLVVGLIAAAVVGTVGVVAYRASQRRRSGGAPPTGASAPHLAGPLGVPPPPPAGPSPPVPPPGAA